ncbi:MAG: gfo/Idh/MocA family oxidoreductase, partial [Saprospiraceae bacterium]|nr:gfo/Idh/MocA family oxidoreductase [Saprospiraceae bacterium]
GHALRSFGECIRENRKPAVGYESGKESSVCVALANKAMQTGEVVKWKDFV